MVGGPPFTFSQKVRRRPYEYFLAYQGVPAPYYGLNVQVKSPLWATDNAQINDLGCSSVNPTLVDCESRRGDLFFSNLSDSWLTQSLLNGADGAIYTLNTKK